MASSVAIQTPIQGQVIAPIDPVESPSDFLVTPIPNEKGEEEDKEEFDPDIQVYISQ